MNQIKLDWDRIDTVFLDMDGTLLDLHFDNHFWMEHLPKRFAEQKRLSIEDAHRHIHDYAQSIEGSLNWYCLDHWQEKLDVDIVGLKHEVAERIKVRGNVERFLSFIKGKSKRIVLLTNAHQKTVALKFSYTNISPFFDRVISSHDVGMAKEEMGFWDRLAEHEDFHLESSLFIDDNLQVLAAAKAHNVGHILAISQPDSQQSLKIQKNLPVLSVLASYWIETL